MNNNTMTTELKRLTYFGYYCEGNAMHMERGTNKVYGWKSPRFGDRELAAISLEYGQKEAPVYVLEDVRWCNDPKDMFFANAKLIGYLPRNIAAGEDAAKERKEAVIRMYQEYIKKS